MDYNNSTNKPKKKKDIDLQKIRGLYITEMEEIKKIYLNYEDIHQWLIALHPTKTLNYIEEVKKKFMKLKDKFEFNKFNEDFYNEKTAKIVDFYKVIKEESNSKDLTDSISEINNKIELLNKMIKEEKINKFNNIFGKDKDLE